MLLVIVCCLLPWGLAAQNQPVSEADSLLRLLAVAKEDTNKVELLDKISEVYQSGAGKDKVMQYATRELELARKLGWIKGQVKGLDALGIAYAINGDYQKLFVYENEAVGAIP